jgi:cobalamin biosynthesis protein CobT
MANVYKSINEGFLRKYGDLDVAPKKALKESVEKEKTEVVEAKEAEKLTGNAAKLKKAFPELNFGKGELKEDLKEDKIEELKLKIKDNPEAAALVRDILEILERCEDCKEKEESEEAEEEEAEDESVEEASKTEIIKEDLAQDLTRYQKWVDYDMKKYGKISGITNRALEKAGLELVKDDHGDYEVIVKEDNGKAIAESVAKRGGIGKRK